DFHVGGEGLGREIPRRGSRRDGGQFRSGQLLQRGRIRRLASGGGLVVASHAQVIKQVFLEHGSQLRVLDDDVPVAIAFPRDRSRAGWIRERIDVRLIGVIPVAARQPKRG